MGRKEEGCCAPKAGELGLRLTRCGLGRGLLPYRVASESIQPFCHNRHGPKIGRGALPPFSGGWLGPHLTQSTGLRPTSIPSDMLIYQAIWPQQIRAENWGAVPLWRGGLTQCGQSRGLRARQVSSCPTVWPQYTNVTDRTDRTDNGAIGQGEPFHKRSPKNRQ